MNTREFIEHILHDSGEIVRSSFGDIVPSTKKIERSQIVTAIDVASERLLIEAITQTYPQSGIIAEESGFIASKDETYWIIDPIDGTSNFAHAIPWFGVMVAYVVNHTVHDSGIYLPMTNEMYTATVHEGVFKNGYLLKPPRRVTLSESLVSVCFSSESESYTRLESSFLQKISTNVLNIRSTNSAYDYAYAIEGKLAATFNQKNKIWDIAPVLLLAKEAGLKVTDIEGKQIHLSLSEESHTKNYSLLIANPDVFDEILSLLV